MRFSAATVRIPVGHETDPGCVDDLGLAGCAVRRCLVAYYDDLGVAEVSFCVVAAVAALALVLGRQPMQSRRGRLVSAAIEVLFALAGTLLLTGVAGRRLRPLGVALLFECARRVTQPLRWRRLLPALDALPHDNLSADPTTDR